MQKEGFDVLSTDWFDPLEKIGTIDKAKVHSEANRPHQIIGTISEKVQFCQCCLLPLPTENAVVRFPFFCKDSKYSVLGLGTYLYFYYILYCFFISLILLCLHSIPEIIISKNLGNELKKYCTNKFGGELMETKSLSICIGYYNVSPNDFWIYRYNYNSITYYKGLFSFLYSDINFMEKTIPTIIILGFGLICLYVVIGVLFIILINFSIHRYNIGINTPSKFTVFIYNLFPFLTKYSQIVKHDEEGINDYINNIATNILNLSDKDNVNNISLAYKLSEFYQLRKQLNKEKVRIYRINNIQEQILLNRKKGFREDLNTLCYFKKKGCCFYQKIKKIDILGKINEMQKEIIEKRNHLQENFAGCLFVTFNTIQDKDNYLNKHNINYCSFLVNCLRGIQLYCCGCCLSKNSKEELKIKKTIKIKPAPEPDDILWENLEATQRIQTLSIIKNSGLSLLLIVLSFIIVCGLNYFHDKIELNYKTKIQREQNNKKIFIISYLISFSISIVISIVNYIIQVILEKLTKEEKPYTKTQMYLSYSLKMTLFTFCNTALVPYIAYLMWGSSIETFIKNLLMIFLTNSLLTPVLWLVNIPFLLTLIKRKLFCVERKVNQNTKKYYYNQRELNSFYERPPMNISLKYSYYTVTLLMSFFYVSIFPIGSCFTVFGFFISYIIEKWNIAYLYKRPEMLNEKICMFYFNNFKYHLFVFSFGNFLFIDEFYKQNGYWTMIYLLFLLALLIFPFGSLFKVRVCMKKNYKKINLIYEDEYFKFSSDYQRENPINKREGIINYLTKMKQKKIIEEKELNKYLLDINNLNLLEIYYKGMNRIRNLTLRELEDAEINRTNSYRSNYELNKEFRCPTYNGLNNLDSSFERELYKMSKGKKIFYNTATGFKKKNQEI